MKSKLSHIHTRWRRIIISLFFRVLLFWGKALQLPSRRARVHWIGHSCRPLRLERPFFFLLIFGGMILLEPREYILWSTLWGGALAIFINLHTIYILIPRKRAHWVR